MIDALQIMVKRYVLSPWIETQISLSLFVLGSQMFYIHIFQGRFPFLDEDVIKTLLDIPLWEIADLEQPSGTGDKKILRQVDMLQSF